MLILFPSDIYPEGITGSFGISSMLPTHIMQPWIICCIPCKWTWESGRMHRHLEEPFKGKWKHSKWLLKHLTISLVPGSRECFLSPVRSFTSFWAWNSASKAVFVCLFACLYIFHSGNIKCDFFFFPSSSSPFFIYIFCFSLWFFIYHEWIYF